MVQAVSLKKMKKICQLLPAGKAANVDILYQRSPFSRDETDRVLAWMQFQRMLQIANSEIVLSPGWKFRLLNEWRPKRGKKRKKQPQPSFVYVPKRNTTPITVSSDKIRANIQHNFTEFLNTSERVWSALRGPYPLTYALDSKSTRMDLQLLSSRLSHYRDKEMISTQQAVRAAQAIRALEALAALEALPNEADLAELEDAFKPFKWPTTEVRGLARRMLLRFQGGVGLLGVYEYHVGWTGDRALDRRHVLKEILEDESSRPRSVYPSAGPPRSCLRLRAVAYSIADCVKRARRRISADMTKAISDWEEDLDWLKRTYYNGRCDGTASQARFLWPNP